MSSQQSATPPGGGATVVIVDDDLDMIYLLTRVLTEGGFDVVGEAATAIEGVALAETKSPDIVILDLSLPGMTGEQATPEFFRRAPRSMVAVISAHLTAEVAERLLGKGAFTAYTKDARASLPQSLASDLALFRQVLSGEASLPVWRYRYRPVVASAAVDAG